MDTQDLTEVKIVVLGGGGVGKSALTIRLVTDNFLDAYDPTIEDSYRKQVVIDGTPILLDILDTAGQEEFQSMQDQWMKEGQVFGLVYSITSPETFDEVECIADRIMRTKDLGGYQDLEDSATLKPIVLIANKCDLENHRRVSIQKGKELAALWGVPFFETSAKDKINNKEVFYELARVHRRFVNNKTDPNSPQSSRKTNKINGAKICKYVTIMLCCICVGIFMLFYYLYRFIVNRIQCCRSREALRKAIAISKKEELARRLKAERQKLKFFAVNKLPIDTIPSPILSLKNFRIKRRFSCKRCCVAILCGVFLPIVVLLQTMAFIVYNITGKFKYYPRLYPYDHIHHNILLDFFGIIVGREPDQDPETVKNKAWFMRQTRTQITQRTTLTSFVLFSIFICYYNALYYQQNFSYVETLGPFVLFWSAWILLSIWIGYEPELYPELPLFSRLKSIHLFFGEEFTHRTDAYKFLRAYAGSRESNHNLSWTQITLIVFLALLYALMPVITRVTVGINELKQDDFWRFDNLFVIISAVCINFLFVVAVVYAIEVQYSKHFDNYREWMHDLTMLLSKDTIDGKKQNPNDSEHLMPEMGSNFSKNLFLSLTRRSNALGWIEIRSFLAIEGQLLFGEQELPTLWLMVATVTLSLFLLLRVYIVHGNPLNSILFNSLTVLNFICILSLARIAVTGYQFEFLQYQQERLWSEQKVYMRYHLSDNHQFEMNKPKSSTKASVAANKNISKIAKSISVEGSGAKSSEKTSLLKPKVSDKKVETELTEMKHSSDESIEMYEVKEEVKEEQNGMIGVFAKRRNEFDSIWTIGKSVGVDDTGEIFEAKRKRINPYSTEFIDDGVHMIKFMDFQSLSKLIDDCNVITEEDMYEIVDTCLDIEKNEAMIVMKEKQRLVPQKDQKKEVEIQKVISLHKMRSDLDGVPEELRVLIQIQNTVDDKLDGINWNSYNFGFMEDLQDIVKSKDIFPRLFKIKLNSVLAKTLASVVFACIVTIVKVFVE